MNEAETALRTALRSLPEPVVAGDLPVRAARSAHRIRRRRLATRGALGAAAVAAGGLAVAPRPGPRSVEPLATTSPAATVSPSPQPTPARADVFLVTLEERPCEMTTPAAGHECTRGVFTIHPPSGAEEVTVVEDGRPAGTPSKWASITPSALTLLLGDGRTLRAEAEPAGDRAWSFDLTVPEGAAVESVSLVDAATGDAFLTIAAIDGERPFSS